MLQFNKGEVRKRVPVSRGNENMEVLSSFGHKLLFSEKYGYKNLFQDENLAQNNPILHQIF